MSCCECCKFCPLLEGLAPSLSSLCRELENPLARRKISTIKDILKETKCKLSAYNCPFCKLLFKRATIVNRGISYGNGELHNFEELRVDAFVKELEGFIACSCKCRFPLEGLACSLSVSCKDLTDDWVPSTKGILTDVAETLEAYRDLCPLGQLYLKRATIVNNAIEPGYGHLRKSEKELIAAFIKQLEEFIEYL